MRKLTFADKRYAQGDVSKAVSKEVSQKSPRVPDFETQKGILRRGLGRLVDF
jgi:hypothetical protein